MIRFFDIFLSSILLIVLTPLFVLLSILIKADSNGPIFYKQKRVGKCGSIFLLLKLRSMYLNSDNSELLTVGNRDLRITRSGYFIRKYKLDELPQLINVLIGDMSMVGPRPEVMKYVNLYTEEQKTVLSVKPGVTDYASIYFKNENELLANSCDPEKIYTEEIMPLKIKLNMIFINNPSLKQYFRILFLTIKRIFR